MQIFTIIETVFKLIGIWNGLLDYIDKKQIADLEQKEQDLSKALEDEKGAKDEKGFDSAQSDISKLHP